MIYDLYIPWISIIRLFDDLEVMVPYYCYEVWGTEWAIEIEKFHTKFLEESLKLKRSTLLDIAYGVTNRVMQELNRLVARNKKTVRCKKEKLCKQIMIQTISR